MKSEGKGIMEKDAPVSKTIGRVGARFGWRVGTELEVVVAVEAETTGVGVVLTVAVTTEVVGVGEWRSPIRESNR